MVQIILQLRRESVGQHPDSIDTLAGPFPAIKSSNLQLATIALQQQGARRQDDSVP
ncbi:hypothetical protein [Arsukibacterium ikkense]|nr:hypothetical protein [Arsukibacterium ikkense]